MTVATEYHTDREAIRIAQIGEWFGPAGQGGYPAEELDQGSHPAGPPDASSAADSEQPNIERRLLVALAIVALLSLLLAVLANWLWVPWKWGTGTMPLRMSAPFLEGPAVGLKTAVNELPESVLMFETITRQVVPGSGGRAVEAVYVTLNMDIEAQVPIAVYARAQKFDSPAQAGQQAQNMMAPYNTGVTSVPVGIGTAARAGYSPDRGSFVITWIRGSEVFFVKSTFRDKIPAQKRKFLEAQGFPVFNAINAYISSGKRSLKL